MLGAEDWLAGQGLRDGFRPREKNPFNKRAGSGPQVMAHGSGIGMKTRPEPDPLPFLKVGWGWV